MLPIHLALSPEERRRQYLASLPTHLRAIVEAQTAAEPWRPGALPPSELLRQAELAADATQTPRPTLVRLDPGPLPSNDAIVSPPGTDSFGSMFPIPSESRASTPDNHNFQVAFVQALPIIYGALAGGAAIDWAAIMGLMGAGGLAWRSMQRAEEGEDECYEQYKRDSAFCGIVARTLGARAGRACRAQAAKRLAACIRGETPPPLNY